MNNLIATLHPPEHPVRAPEIREETKAAFCGSQMLSELKQHSLEKLNVLCHHMWFT